MENLTPRPKIEGISSDSNSVQSTPVNIKRETDSLELYKNNSNKIKRPISSSSASQNYSVSELTQGLPLKRNLSSSEMTFAKNPQPNKPPAFEYKLVDLEFEPYTPTEKTYNLKRIPKLSIVQTEVQKVEEFKDFASNPVPEELWYEKAEKSSNQISNENPFSNRDWDLETRNILDVSNDSCSIKREEFSAQSLFTEPKIEEEIESFSKLEENSSQQKSTSPPNEVQTADPKQIFHRIVDDAVITSLVDGINACWKANPNPACTKKLKWVDVTDSELKNFICSLYLMGIIRKVRLLDYWAGEPQKGANNEVRNMIAKERFEQLVHCFESVNEKGLPSSSLTFMLTQFCEAVLKNSRNHYEDSKILTLDASNVRLGISNKAKLAIHDENKIKAFVVAESTTGYVVNCELRKILERDRGALLETAQRLLKPLKDCGYSVYLAPECTSNKLLSELSSLNIKACGKIPPKYLQVPPVLHKEIFSLPQVASRQYLINNQTIGFWKDEKEVFCLLSTIHFPTEDKRNSLFNRISREEKSAFTTLKDKLNLDEMMESYKGNINGVKAFDEKMIRCSNHHIFASQRLPMLIFYFFLEVAMVNSYVIYLSTVRKGKRILTPKDYRILVLETLSGVAEKNSVQVQNIRITKESVREQKVESLSKMGRCFLVSVEKAAICKVCCSDPKNQRIRTSYRCQTCKIPVCVVGCYDYHRLIVEGGKLLPQ